MSRKHENFHYVSLSKEPPHNLVGQNNDLSFLIILWVRNSRRTWLGSSSAPCYVPCCEVTSLVGLDSSQGSHLRVWLLGLPSMVTVLPHGWFGFLHSIVVCQGSWTSYVIADSQEGRGTSSSPQYRAQKVVPAAAFYWSKSDRRPSHTHGRKEIDSASLGEKQHRIVTTPASKLYEKVSQIPMFCFVFLSSAIATVS